MTDAYDPSLVLNFPFFSGVNAAGDIPDQSGYGNDGDIASFADDDSEFIDDHLGQAIDLDGVNKFVDCGNSLDFQGNNITVECWFSSSNRCW